MRLVALVLSFCLLVLSGSPACIRRAPSTVHEVVLGEYSALTGAESAFGVGTHRGIELAVEEVNAAGGVKGKPVRLITYDTEGKTDVAVTVVTRLITQDRVHVILGEVASTRSIAAGSIAQRSSVPMISPSSTNPRVTQLGDYIFRVCFIDPFQGLVVARFAMETLALKTAAILRDIKSDYSVGLADYFTQEYKRLGGRVVTDLGYSAGDLDFKSQLTAIQADKPEILFVPGYYTEAGLIARQARELGFQGVLVGGDGWDGDPLTEIGGKAVVGAYFSNHYSDGDMSPLVQAFVKRYRARFGDIPNSSAVMGYEAGRLAADAIGRAKDLSHPAIRDAIASTKNFDGVTGRITIDNLRNAVKPAVIVRVATNKTFEYVTTVTP